MPRKASRSVKGETGLIVKFRPVVTESTPAFYSNHVEVMHSPYDFVLIFAKVSPKLRPEQVAGAKKGEVVPIDALLQVEIPIRLMEGLVNALKTQKESYEQHYGAIRASTSTRGRG